MYTAMHAVHLKLVDWLRSVQSSQVTLGSGPMCKSCEYIDLYRRNQ